MLLKIEVDVLICIEIKSSPSLEGQGLEHQSPDETSCDRPLTAGGVAGAHTDNPASSYAARAGGHHSGAATSHPLGEAASGKGTTHVTLCPPGGQWLRGKNGSAGGSFADMLKGKSDFPSDPIKEPTVEDNLQSVMDELGNKGIGRPHLFIFLLEGRFHSNLAV